MMITRENIASAVFQSVGAWACPNGGNCDCDCGKCAERLVKEYEDALRAEGARAYRESLPNFNLAKHDEGVRNKTIEEIRSIFCKDLFDRYSWCDGTINFNNCSLMILEIIEKLKEGEET